MPKYTVHSLKKKKEKKKKKKKKKEKEKKKVKWNAAWDNYSAQKCVQIWVDHDAGIHPLTVFTN